MIPGQSCLQISRVDQAHRGLTCLPTLAANEQKAPSPAVGLKAQPLQELFVDNDLVAARGKLVLVS